MDLLKISLGIAIVGLVALYLVAQNHSSITYTVADLNDDFYGKVVSVKGTITSVSTSKDGNVFFTLTDQTGSLDAVAFKKSGIAAPKKGSIVKAEGSFEKYQNKPEIIVKKIEVLSEA